VQPLPVRLGARQAEAQEPGLLRKVARQDAGDAEAVEELRRAARPHQAEQRRSAHDGKSCFAEHRVEPRGCIGEAQAPDAALMTAPAEKKWLNGWSAAATFEGEFSNVTTSYAGKGAVRHSW
jgi:hypothetical protein